MVDVTEHDNPELSIPNTAARQGNRMSRGIDAFGLFRVGRSWPVLYCLALKQTGRRSTKTDGISEGMPVQMEKADSSSSNRFLVMHIAISETGIIAIFLVFISMDGTIGGREGISDED